MNSAIRFVPAIALFLLLSFVSFGTPDLIDNESVYLIKSRQIADPGFIASDWSMGRDAERTHGILFSIVVAPLWLLDLTPLQVAMTVRVLQTLFLLLASIVLLRSLNVSLLPGLIGLSLWVVGGQVAMAGEWVLGGAEQKPFAYAFVLLAISAAIRGRWVAMGILLSVSTWLHILVGAWSAVVLFSASLACERLKAFRAIAGAGVLALILVAPVAYLAIHESVSSTAIYNPIPPYATVADLTINFRVPHHLDPSQFVTLRELASHLLAGACLVAAILFAGFAVRARKILGAITFGLVLVAGIGIAAHLGGANQLLATYPFRVPDGLLPLLAFLTTPYFLMKASKLTQLPSVFARLSLAGCFIAVIAFASLEFQSVNYKIDRAISSWKDAGSSNSDNEKQALYAWIRENTPPDATFLVPPWWHDFRLVAERPAYVMVKTVPNNEMAWEWYRRLTVTNNQNAFAESGFQVYPELRGNYANMSAETLTTIERMNHAQYFVSPSLRPQFALTCVVNIGNICVYDLRLLR